MSEIETKPSIDEMTLDTGEPPVAGHDEWVREQIQKRLDKKRAGNAVYHDLDEVAAEFGF